MVLKLTIIPLYQKQCDAMSALNIATDGTVPSYIRTFNGIAGEIDVQRVRSVPVTVDHHSSASVTKKCMS